jgi:Xaa-Pro dipeptidase
MTNTLPEFQRPILAAQLCNLGRLLETMERRGLDGLVAYLRPNVFYLSSFAPPSGASVHETNGYAAVVISRHAPDQPIIVVAEFDLPYFALQPSWIQDRRPFATLITPLDLDWGRGAIDRFMPATTKGLNWAESAREHYVASLVEGVRGAMSDLALTQGRVGFDDFRLARSLGIESGETVDAYGLLKYVRQVKTPVELDLLRGATQLNQRAIERTVAEWTAGTTWQEMIHRYHVQAVSLGGFVRDPGAIVVSNTAGSETAFFTGAVLEEFEVQPGMRIMWDCHGTWGHYCWDGGKTWLVGGADRAAGRVNAQASSVAMGEIVSAARPGATISSLQAAAREAFRRAGGQNADGVFIFFHGLGLEHIDMELSSSRQDWQLEAGMVVSAHIQVPGDDRSRGWLEEIMLVTPDGGEPFFSWGHEPIMS